MERQMRSDLKQQKAHRVDDAGFTDVVFSWSVDDVYNEELYSEQVEEIPNEFNSVKDYFGAYMYPLLEETRTELHSSLNALPNAPYAHVTDFDESKQPHGTFHYDITVDYWRNRFGHGKDPYKILPGDVLILANTKPSDLRLLEKSWAYALVVNINNDEDDEEDDSISAYFKVKASNDMESHGETWKPMFVVFLMNITTQKRIWNTLHMFRNLQVINRVLSTETMVTPNCQICIYNGKEELTSEYGRFLNSDMNDSQSDAVLSCLRKMKCRHQPSVELIWGPPGTGKTKTVATLLATLLGMRGRILSCAPTNVAITELASRTLKIIRGSVESNRGTELGIYPLGDILLFGNNDRLKVGSEIEDTYLKHRVKKLSECFDPESGWKVCFTTMIDFLENCASKYDAYMKNIEIKKRELKDRSLDQSLEYFAEFVKGLFKSSAVQLKRCLYTMCTHVPKSYIGEGNYQRMVSLIGLLNDFETLLLQNGLIHDKLKDLFSQDQPVNSRQSDVNMVFLLNSRFECIYALKKLQCSLKLLNFPSAISSYAVSDFCFQMASLIFCTVASSYKLYSVKMEPLGVLVIDEAGQLKECESTIPLQLPGIKHAILIGDERQLPATVFSNISSEAGFGKSLFERLSTLGYHKHLLNTQYRMHPRISYFPNSNFYSSSIIDASIVKNKKYKKVYLPGAMFGSYSFINIFGAREELVDEHSRSNLVEVAAVVKIVNNLHKAWSSAKENLSVGVMSPYNAQVVAIQERLGRKYENIDGFEIKVKSVDGFQGGEEDIVIISTVRSNFGGSIGFISSSQRTNVALTRARHCLWILGDERTLSRSASIWAHIILDAKKRKCFYNAADDEDLAKTILEVKNELNQLNDLLNADSVLFRSARWKVLFSDDFKKSFKSLSSNQIKKSVINLLLKLSGGWQPKRLHGDTFCKTSSHNLKQFKVENLFVICTVDIIKESQQYLQVLKIWNLLPLEKIPKLVKRLDGIFSRYTEDYINHCNEKSHDGGLEVPTRWSASVDLIQFKTANEIGSEFGSSTSDDRDYVENSKVSESLLLMKFYPLSSDVVRVLLSEDSRELDLLFEVTNEEREIILFDKSTFVLGRSGTGKTTVLTMKLFLKERQHYLVTQEIYGTKGHVIIEEDPTEASRPPVLQQLFVTVSRKLCLAVKQHVSSHLKRFACSRNFLAERQSIDVDYADDTTLFKGIPDAFVHIPSTAYPLIITFKKFLLMLDGTIGKSYFERFPTVQNSAQGKTGRSNSVQTFIRMNEVTYDLFCSAYWSHFNDQFTKKLDSSRVYTEITSHIIGGLHARDGKLSLDEYLQLSKTKVSTIGKKKREMIYDIFQQYEKMKVENGHFDWGDLVNDLHLRFTSEGYHGDQMDFVYIDEVQDLTMRQISLFKYICKNVDEGFVFSGDTAQTIARGVDFRFQDIRSLFYKEFFPSSLADGVKKKGRLSKIFHLSQNFRTHAGVLKLAQSVIDLIFRFFPKSIDVLCPETSMIYGGKPILLESGQNENAIKTIFGHSCNASRQITGFGAEQVILVRDDKVRQEISECVGKQALVLTIVECKGLEFQDVLLYNFFASSPLKNQWRVIYEYMKEQNLLGTGSHVAFPSFNESKHSLMCSELKQLYVAITRTRQRLWICENIEDFSKPMFDYWKKQCFVQVRVLDESLAQAMQVASTPEEWKSRGLKLLAESNYEMATMCFERAGDEYWEKFSKAEGLRADADLKRISDPDKARSILKEAAEMFDAIGKADRAAECFFDLEDFEKAGKLYLESCGQSKLDLAGDCFYRAGCYELAAEVYAKGKCFAQCLKVCTTNAEFFEMGLQYIQYWNLHAEKDSVSCRRSMDIEKMEQKFLEDCANHYHGLKENQAMMRFVKSFHSSELMRAFLMSRSCLDELVSLEEELGNFLEAAEIVKQRGNLLREADLLGKAGKYKEASAQILWCALAHSFSTPDSTGWPLKQFRQKEELLTKAEGFAKKDSHGFWEAMTTEVGVLSDKKYSLPEMHQFLRASMQHRSFKVEILSSRKILDVLLRFDISKFFWEDELVADLAKHSEDKILKNQVSLETFVYFWNFWKDKVLKIFHCLESLDRKKESDDYNDYDEFLLNVMGVWRRVAGKSIDFILISSDMRWLKGVNKSCIIKIGDLVSIDLQSLITAARSYWSVELLFVGKSVLGFLELLYRHSTKNSMSLFCSSMSLIHIFEAAQFLFDCRFLQIQSSDDYMLPKYFQLASDDLSTYLFPRHWRRSVVENMVTLRLTERYQKVLEEVILMMLSGELTHGLLVRVVTILMASAGFSDNLYAKVLAKFVENPPWHMFVDTLRAGVEQDLHSECMPPLGYFAPALQCDYMPLSCFVYFLERLVILASCSSGLCFTAKSSYVEWFISNKMMQGPAISTEQRMGPLEYVKCKVEQILVEKSNTWSSIIRSNPLAHEDRSNPLVYQLLILRLVFLLCVICLNTGKYHDALFHWLGQGHIAAVLPRGFTDLLWKCKRSGFFWKVNLIAEAFAMIENPLVIVSNGKDCSKFMGSHAILIKADDQKDVIFRKLFPVRITRVAGEKASVEEFETAASHITEVVSSVSANPVKTNVEPPPLTEPVHTEKQNMNTDNNEPEAESIKHEGEHGKNTNENNIDAVDEADEVYEAKDDSDGSMSGDSQLVSAAGNGSQGQKNNQGGKSNKKNEGGGNGSQGQKNNKKNKGGGNKKKNKNGKRH